MRRPRPASASPRVLVAAPETGAGKTTVAMGLLAALRRRGVRVQPFKVGPDYIDPGFLTSAAGRQGRNLDAWLLPAGTVRWLFDRHAASASAAVVEGMMGLFDGYSGSDDEGSSAHVARLLGLPVLVVLDASRAARSIAAVARGCQVLARRIEIVGWILNRVAGEAHLRWVREAVEQATGRPVLGHLPDDPRLRLPERHRGLVQAHDRRGGQLAAVLARLAREVESRFELDHILRLTRRAASAGPGRCPCDAVAGAGPPAGRRPVIAWADDEAFSFHYAENIELVETLGARVVRWSPLRDRDLPAGTGALVLGGGYPELYAEHLACARRALEAVRTFARHGGAIYAECGGFMYLARGIASGRRRIRLAGIVPAWVRMGERTQVAYVEVEAVRDTLLVPRGERVRGHEFHVSRLERPLPRGAAAYRVLTPAPRPEGFAGPRLLASYVHLNFLGRPGLAARLVAAASRPP